MASSSHPEAFRRRLGEYDYRLPEELIAQAPAKPRDSARLLVYDRPSRKAAFDRFQNLARYLPKKAVLVFNQTKVLPARLFVRKPTGGKVELVYLGERSGKWEVLSNKHLLAGTRLVLSRQIWFWVLRPLKKGYLIKPSFPTQRTKDILNRYGQTPIPPYIKHSPLSERRLRSEYQAIFAKTAGSIAAPTASLHFTKALLKKLSASEIAVKFVTLHVGLGTFAPLTAENLRAKKLHSESYTIDSKTAAFLNRAKAQGRPIVAVGTTTIRTLESAASLCHSGSYGAKRRASRNPVFELKKLSGGTELFIAEGDRLKFADALITNFHVPKSSLMMLVAALAGRKKLLQLYRSAIKKKMRFFSFGDGMLIK